MFTSMMSPATLLGAGSPGYTRPAAHAAHPHPHVQPSPKRLSHPFHPHSKTREVYVRGSGAKRPSSASLKRGDALGGGAGAMVGKLRPQSAGAGRPGAKQGHHQHQHHHHHHPGHRGAPATPQPRNTTEGRALEIAKYRKHLARLLAELKLSGADADAFAVGKSDPGAPEAEHGAELAALYEASHRLLCSRARTLDVINAVTQREAAMYSTGRSSSAAAARPMSAHPTRRTGLGGAGAPRPASANPTGAPLPADLVNPIPEEVAADRICGLIDAWRAVMPPPGALGEAGAAAKTDCTGRPVRVFLWRGEDYEAVLQREAAGQRRPPPSALTVSTPKKKLSRAAPVQQHREQRLSRAQNVPAPADAAVASAPAFAPGAAHPVGNIVRHSVTEAQQRVRQGWAAPGGGAATAVRAARDVPSPSLMHASMTSAPPTVAAHMNTTRPSLLTRASLHAAVSTRTHTSHTYATLDEPTGHDLCYASADGPEASSSPTSHPDTADASAPSSHPTPCEPPAPCPVPASPEFWCNSPKAPNRARQAAAAARIQACYRGSLARRRSAYLRMRVEAVTKLQSWVRMRGGQKRAAWWRRVNGYATKIQKVVRGFLVRKWLRADGILLQATVRIQATYRGWRDRRAILRLIRKTRREESAAQVISAQWALYKAKRLREDYVAKSRAQTKIALMWKAHAARAMCLSLRQQRQLEQSARDEYLLNGHRAKQRDAHQRLLKQQDASPSFHSHTSTQSLSDHAPSPAITPIRSTPTAPPHHAPTVPQPQAALPPTRCDKALPSPVSTPLGAGGGVVTPLLSSAGFADLTQGTPGAGGIPYGAQASHTWTGRTFARPQVTYTAGFIEPIEDGNWLVLPPTAAAKPPAPQPNAPQATLHAAAIKDLTSLGSGFTAASVARQRAAADASVISAPAPCRSQLDVSASASEQASVPSPNVEAAAHRPPLPRFGSAAPQIAPHHRILGGAVALGSADACTPSAAADEAPSGFVDLMATGMATAVADETASAEEQVREEAVSTHDVLVDWVDDEPSAVPPAVPQPASAATSRASVESSEAAPAPVLVLLQRCGRGASGRRRVGRRRRQIVVVQSVVRRFLAVCRVRRIFERDGAARLIQAAWRAFWHGAGRLAEQSLRAAGAWSPAGWSDGVVREGDAPQRAALSTAGSECSASPSAASHGLVGRKYHYEAQRESVCESSDEVAFYQSQKAWIRRIEGFWLGVLAARERRRLWEDRILASEERLNHVLFLQGWWRYILVKRQNDGKEREAYLKRLRRFRERKALEGSAAVIIQSVWRGYRHRTRSAAIAARCHAIRARADRRIESALKIQRTWRINVTRRKVQARLQLRSRSMEAVLTAELVTEAIVRIQALVRGHLARRCISSRIALQRDDAQKAIVLLQKVVRGFLARAFYRRNRQRLAQQRLRQFEDTRTELMADWPTDFKYPLGSSARPPQPTPEQTPEKR